MAAHHAPTAPAPRARRPQSERAAHAGAPPRSADRRNPRQIAVPLLTPILFALVIAPALKTALGGLHTHIDYTAFVAVGTVGLLVPLTTTFAGLSVIVDRDSGAQRELLAAPIPRALLVLGNLAVALALATLPGRRADRRRRAARSRLPRQRRGRRLVRRRRGAVHRADVRRRRDAGGEAPAAGGVHRRDARSIAILPWFFAGALFPIARFRAR